MSLSIYGIEVEAALADMNDEMMHLWEEFLTDYLQEYENPDDLEYNAFVYAGEFDLAFEYAILGLIEEDVMISEQWLDVLEATIYLDQQDQKRFADYAKRVRAHHAKASA